MGRTRISWTDYSLNPGVYGCSPAHSGCWNCYAATMAHRLAGMGQSRYDGLTRRIGWGGGVEWLGKVRVDFDAVAPAFANLPKRKPARVFVTSMGDLFHEQVPDEFIWKVMFEFAGRPHLTGQFLTKRPARILDYMQWRKDTGKYDLQPYWPADNIQIGVSCSTQTDVDRMVPDLLRVPARVRFLNLEPLLGPVSLPTWYDEMTSTTDLGGIGWVIVGCESGPHRRPCRVEWVRSIVEQCDSAGVPCFVKQLDIAGRVSRDPAEWPENLRVQEFPEDTP